MEGNKIRTLFVVVAFVLATLAKNSIAKDIPSKNKNAPISKGNEIPPEVQALESCAKNCKPDDSECPLDCLKKALGGQNKIDMKEFEKELKVVVRGIFCVTGCMSSGLCPEIDNIEEANKCMEGCAKLCGSEV